MVYLRRRDFAALQRARLSQNMLDQDAVSLTAGGMGATSEGQDHNPVFQHLPTRRGALSFLGSRLDVATRCYGSIVGGLTGSNGGSSGNAAEVQKQTEQQQKMLARQQFQLSKQSAALTQQAASLASAVPTLTIYETTPAATVLADPPSTTDASGAAAEADKTLREKEARRRGYASTIKAGDTGGYVNPVTGSGSLLG